MVAQLLMHDELLRGHSAEDFAPIHGKDKYIFLRFILQDSSVCTILAEIVHLAYTQGQADPIRVVEV